MSHVRHLSCSKSQSERRASSELVTATDSTHIERVSMRCELGRHVYVQGQGFFDCKGKEARNQISESNAEDERNDSLCR